MSKELKPGIKGDLCIKVEKKDTAAAYGSGLIEVFATPAMIGLMEKTAQLSVQEFLPDGFITLGIEVNICHIKATPVGQKVTCFSELTEVNDRQLTFFVKAFDEVGEIGSGTHKRFIVDGEKFIKKIQR